MSVSSPTFLSLQSFSKDTESRLKTADRNQILRRDGLQPYLCSVIVPNWELECWEGRCGSLIKTVDPTRVYPSTFRQSLALTVGEDEDLEEDGTDG